MPALLLVVLLLVSAGASGQAKRVLQPVDDVRLSDAYAHAMSGHARCDAEGDVYFPLNAVAESFDAALRPSQDGRASTRYALREVTGLEHYTMMAIAVGREGELYALANNAVELAEVARGAPPPAITPELVSWLQASGNGSPQSVVVTFDKSGKYRSRFTVNSPLIPFQVASFGGERFFLAGMMPAQPGGTDYRAFAGVFDRQGLLVREVRLESDPALDEEFNVRYADAEAGADGNVYYVRHGGVGTIDVISRQGEVLRHVRVEAPPGLSVSTVKVGAKGIAVLAVRLVPAGAPGSFKTEALVVSVLDAESGKLLEQYGRDSPLITGGGFACYAGDTFTFFAHPEGDGIHLVHARAK